MELLVWNAARKLAWLVLGALAIVSVPFAMDTRIGVLPAASGGIAVALLLVSLVPLRRAACLLRRLHAAPKLVPAAAVYRASARSIDLEPEEREATHQSAVALLLLALAAALVVVAAAAR